MLHMIDEEVQPLDVLHEMQENAQKTYNKTVTKAKQDRDEAILDAQKQYQQALKEYNAAIEAASRK
jgi:F0F1-type ATP synthase membrane subunit b/b'